MVDHAAKAFSNMLKLFATSKSDHEIMSVYVIRYVVFHKSRGIYHTMLANLWPYFAMMMMMMMMMMIFKKNISGRSFGNCNVKVEHPKIAFSLNLNHAMQTVSALHWQVADALCRTR